MQDFETWTLRKRNTDEGYPRKSFNSDIDKDPSDQYKRDKARIIHSASFRRLQGKTQVLSLGESDFYRTRLTHSLEVAQLGSSICDHLKTKYKSNKESREWIPDTSLIESICLAHDLGHPPFGHGGEIALNKHMKDSGGFEGNGHTLRIVSSLGEYSPHNGLDLTRRTLLGLLKYPVTHFNACKYSKLDESKKDKPPKCIHDDEKEILDWILLPLEENDKQNFLYLEEAEHFHNKTKYKSFDASIMELADDIAYAVHDLEDAIALGFIDEYHWQEHIINESSLLETHVVKNKNFYTEKLFSKSNKQRKHAISKLISQLVNSIEIEENQGFKHPLLKRTAKADEHNSALIENLKKMTFEHVIKRPQVQALEMKGQRIIDELFKIYEQHPEKLLKHDDYQKLKDSANKKRIICDYISGMTDLYATNQYRRIFMPDIGSIFDHI